MKAQMIRVISSPSSSTIGFLTSIFATRPHPTIRPMATVERPPAEGATHEVFNQSSPLEDYNVFDADTVLAEAVRREGAGWAEERCRELGAVAGSAQVIRWGFEANEKEPRL